MEIIRGVKYIHTVLLYIIFLEEKIAQIDAEIDLYVIIIPYITNTVFCSILRHIFSSSNYCTCSIAFENIFAYSIDGVLKYIINIFFKSHIVLKLEVGVQSLE